MISNVDDIESLYAEYGIEKEILGKISIWRGDITKLKVDVIVNAANERLLGGGGIDGAIHRAAGWDELQKECRKHGSCQVGSTVATSACNLRHVKRIFHTVGPQPRGGQPTRHDEADLVSCYRSSLNLAVENNYRTIAFPCISTGIYGYPNQAAAHRVINFLYNFFTEQKNRNLIDRVVLVLFVDIDIRCYNQAIKGLVDCIRRVC